MRDPEAQFEDAGKFLDYLRLSSGNWGDGWECHWIFRGQESDEWPLLPRAWRKTTLTDFAGVSKGLEGAAQEGWQKLKTGRGGLFGLAHGDPIMSLIENHPKIAEDRIPRVLLQLAFESEVLREFVLMGEELGYRAGNPEDDRPGDHLARHPRAKQIFNQNMREEGGLAQHHGIPTRLLDWTRRPEVAAFFAALRPTRGRMAVWALDIRSCRKPTKAYTPTVAIHTCRRYRHSFLHAQDGLFTWIPLAEAYYLDNGCWPSVPEILEQDEEHQVLAGVSCPVRQVTLSSNQRGELLRLLWREKISQAHLMPTYDYIAKSLRLRWSLGL